MPRFKHVIEANYTPTFRTEKVAGMFDVPVTNKLRREWDVDIPIEDKKWQIGLIIGASGSGKTTIAKRLFDEKVHSNFEWIAPCLLDDFPADADVKKITETLSRVGFSSPPQWLLPYSALSNGQKFRVELARCLFEYDDIFVFDEFTSVVDRQAAQIGAFAFQKAVRKTKRQFVAVTCHYDVEEWLQPDWVFDVSGNIFKWGCLRRPEIKLEVYPCKRQIWSLFKGHHYLNADISASSRVFCGFIDDRPIALTAILHFPHPKSTGMWKEHRTVVLPDFQGFGIGNIMSEAIGDILLTEGKRFISTTSHPSMMHHRINSRKWRMTRKPSRVSPNLNGNLRGTVSASRITASFEYFGDRYQ